MTDYIVSWHDILVHIQDGRCLADSNNMGRYDVSNASHWSLFPRYVGSRVELKGSPR
jgi:hypothetical protein